MLYSWLLSKPHVDKEGLEVLMLRASSKNPTPSTEIASTDLLPSEQYTSVKEDFLPEVIVLRPAM